jgi:DNA polymerase-3 subunit epsilon
MAAKAGGDVQPSVTKRTTMLVVGQRDLMPGWAAKSAKHLRAEALIEQGQDIRIVGEADFQALAAITE